MDELELLKQKWQTRDQELPKLSYNDIYKMLLRKSSSVVKWIFIISIIELLFWTLLMLFIPESSKEFNEGMGLKNTMLIITIINYIVLFIFIYLFYKNYQRIQVTDSSSELMGNILRTRKTVWYFVVYNVGASVLSLIGTNIYYYFNRDKLLTIMSENFDGIGNLPAENFISVFFLSQLIVGVVFIGIIMLIYRLVYGTLLGRLKRNYQELRKMEL
jgi:hypothetical protein